MNHLFLTAIPILFYGSTQYDAHWRWLNERVLETGLWMAYAILC